MSFMTPELFQIISAILALFNALGLAGIAAWSKSKDAKMQTELALAKQMYIETKARLDEAMEKLALSEENQDKLQREIRVLQTNLEKANQRIAHLESENSFLAKEKATLEKRLIDIENGRRIV